MNQSFVLFAGNVLSLSGKSKFIPEQKPPSGEPKEGF